jgi:hypothetical protein
MPTVIPTLLALVLFTAGSGSAWAQGADDRFGIKDNSFLVEEAINQDPGIFQNIFVTTRNRAGEWEGNFTSEFPIGSLRHQISFTVPYSSAASVTAVGDAMLNYRFGVSDGSGRAPAFTPRLSLIVPTSAARRDWGSRGLGWQVNLPFSKQVDGLYFHWNAGATLMRGDLADAASDAWAASPFLAGSTIVAITPMLNLVLEAMYEADATAAGREHAWTMSPGVRVGWNIGPDQVVLGVAVPVTRGGRRDVGVLGYASYELPFVW